MPKFGLEAVEGSCCLVSAGKGKGQAASEKEPEEEASCASLWCGQRLVGPPVMLPAVWQTLLRMAGEVSRFGCQMISARFSISSWPGTRAQDDEEEDDDEDEEEEEEDIGISKGKAWLKGKGTACTSLPKLDSGQRAGS